MSGFSTRPLYDNCAYKQQVQQSTSPFVSHMDSSRFNNCGINGSNSGNFNKVDIESELQGLSQFNGRCDQYMSPFNGGLDINDPQLSQFSTPWVFEYGRPGDISINNTNMMPPTDCGIRQNTGPMCNSWYGKGPVNNVNSVGSNIRPISNSTGITSAPVNGPTTMSPVRTGTQTSGNGVVTRAPAQVQSSPVIAGATAASVGVIANNLQNYANYIQQQLSNQWNSLSADQQANIQKTVSDVNKYVNDLKQQAVAKWNSLPASQQASIQTQANNLQNRLKDYISDLESKVQQWGNQVSNQWNNWITDEQAKWNALPSSQQNSIVSGIQQKLANAGLTNEQTAYLNQLMGGTQAVTGIPASNDAFAPAMF